MVDLAHTEVATASWMRRAGAWMIDWILVGCAELTVVGIIGVVTGGSANHPHGHPPLSPGEIVGAISLVAALISVPAIFYFAPLVGSKRGQTVGMMATGIAVRDATTADSIGRGRAALRHLLACGFATALVAPYLLDCLAALWDKERRTWHDRLSKTTVVRLPRAHDAGALPFTSIPNIHPPPGWYRDPSQLYTSRYWDGIAWTEHVSADALGYATATATIPAPSEETLPGLPPRALWIAVSGLVGALLLGGVGYFIGGLLMGHSAALRLVLGESGLWAGVLAAAIIATRRFGTGSLRDDFGWRIERRDLLRGVGLGLGCRFGASIVAGVLIVAVRHGATNAGTVTGLPRDRAALLAFTLIAIIGAPFFEELYFRGLLLRSLESVVRRPVAIALQATIFAGCHFNAVLGWLNVPEMIAIGLFGAVLAILATRYQRLGPGMATHSIFNLLASIGIIIVLIR